jgi:hypothetical protein
MHFDPKKLAVEYYFGDLQYWKLSGIAADALVEGYDGPALRSLAGWANPVASDIRDKEIDSAFREMGVAAPIAKDEARLILAIESAQKALDGRSNVFDEATYVRVHLCELADPPDALKCVVNLSNEAKNAPRPQWSRIESDLKQAFRWFLVSQKTQSPE